LLYKKTVDASTLELLIQLQQKEYLKNFPLVGGTALALNGLTNPDIAVAHRDQLRTSAGRHTVEPTNRPSAIVRQAHYGVSGDGGLHSKAASASLGQTVKLSN
jgi:hypothetical protein